ncbi:MAG: hypothetical protein ABIN74_00045 [Ferruginibacter sp.]
MNKTATFLIIVLLVARGLLYIYDHNKNKIDEFVSPTRTVIRDTSINTEPSDSFAVITDLAAASPTAITFLVTDKTDIYYYVGTFNGNLYTIDYNYVGVFIKAYKNAVISDDLMFIIKSDKSSTFNSVIGVLDEMSKNEVTSAHYKEAEISKEEMDKIKLLKNIKNG